MNLKQRLYLGAASLLAFGLQVWGIGRPSLWADEVATVAAASRPLPALLQMMKIIDAVHGTYYLLIHFLGKLFGFGPIALRLPSAIAVTAAVICTFLLANKLFGPKVAWFAFVVAAFLPRLTWASTEARSYGIDALLGVALMLIFVHVVTAETDRRAKRMWIAYTAVAALAIHFFVYIALMIGSQGLWLLVRWLRSGRTASGRQAFLRWLAATGIAIGVAGYLIVVVVMEKGQVGWLPAISHSTLDEVFVGQAFWSDPSLAFVANTLIIVMLLGAAYRGRVPAPGQWGSVLLLLCAIVVPPAIILAYSLVGGSIYDARYFTFAAPFVAILLALSLARLFNRWISVLALMLVVALSLPAYFGFRAPGAKGTHWGQVAHLIHRNALPGDAILYTDFDRKSPSQSRISIAYPKEFRGITDLTVTKPYYRSPGLYPRRADAAAVAYRFGSFRRILVLQVSTEKPEFRKLNDLLTAKGFRVSRRVRVFNTWLNIFTKP